jgi:hypothetical protein
VDPAVLAVHARACGHGVPRALDIAGHSARIATAATCEHLRIPHGNEAIRLDVVSGTVLDGPVAIEPVIRLDDTLSDQLGAVRRLDAFLRGAEPRVQPERHLARLVLGLRVLDARRDGASLRDIAHGLFGHDWPGDGDCIKSRVRRLVALSEAMARAGPTGVFRNSI